MIRIQQMSDSKDCHGDQSMMFAVYDSVGHTTTEYNCIQGRVWNYSGNMLLDYDEEFIYFEMETV